MDHRKELLNLLNIQFTVEQQFLVKQDFYLTVSSLMYKDDGKGRMTSFRTNEKVKINRHGKITITRSDKSCIEFRIRYRRGYVFNYRVLPEFQEVIWKNTSHLEDVYKVEGEY